MTRCTRFGGVARILIWPAYCPNTLSYWCMLTKRFFPSHQSSWTKTLFVDVVLFSPVAQTCLQMYCINFPSKKQTKGRKRTGLSRSASNENLQGPRELLQVGITEGVRYLFSEDCPRSNINIQVQHQHCRFEEVCWRM